LRKNAQKDHVGSLCDGTYLYQQGETIIGQTQVVTKTLSPMWNEKFDLVPEADDAVLKSGIDLLFAIQDHDLA